MTQQAAEPKTQTRARIVADSISPAGHRLTTFEIRIHRFVHAEFMTHRVFSRNSASSRAIPLAKQLDRVFDDPALPLVWASEQRGMQGGDEIEDTEYVEGIWLQARDNAAMAARRIGDFGVHKSLPNRLIEPFMWHTVVVTATAWDNFFGLRCSPLAQPEIRDVAEVMKYIYDANEPTEIGEGEWHLPYILDDEHPLMVGENGMPWDLAVKVSSARCARVSYLTQNGVRDHEQDAQLYDRLTSADPMHASPLEHVATPNQGNIHWVGVYIRGDQQRHSKTLMLPKYGNLIGWHQHRFDVEIAKGYQAYS